METDMKPQFDESKVDTDLGDEVKQAEASTWLSRKDYLPAERSRDEGHPDIDVVHVAAICPNEDMHDLKDLITSIKTERREFVFRFEAASLLVGDLVYKSLEWQATRLLHSLSKVNVSTGRTRAIIFIAYDLGAIVVKLALSLAAKQGNEYSDIFTRAAQFVFSGCLQRSSDIQTMELKLYQFLSAQKDEKLLRIKASSIHSLADSILRTTEMFISSKITLRSRVISLYANKENPVSIHPALDYFTATLGVSSEIILQEKCGESLVNRFPSLPQRISYNSQNWIPPVKWIHMEKVLLACSSPHYQFKVSSPPPYVPHSILGSEKHVEWVEYVGPQILYIHGNSYSLTHDVADQMFLAWQAKYQVKDTDNATALSFHFDSLDPLRNSISDMVASIIIQFMAGGAEDVAPCYENIHDAFLFNGGWTEKSWINILDIMKLHRPGKPHTLLLLHNLDECSKQSRAEFLEYYKKLLARTEHSLKIIVTSRQPNSLLEELHNCSRMNLDDSAIHIHANMGNIADHLTHSCPTEQERDQIKSNLERLALMENTNLRTSLKLIQDHTGWPEDPSLGSLAQFIDLLNQIAPHDAPEKVLDMVIRSNHDMDGLCWTLNWVLCAYRPLSWQELIAVVLLHDQKTGVQSPDASPSFTWSRRWSQLESWLRVLAVLSYDQVLVRNEIRDLLVEDTETDKFIWNEVRRTGHQILTEFCFNHISMVGTQSQLDSLFQKYQSQTNLKQQSQQIATPVMPDGTDITYYVIQSLPYHLNRCPKNEITQDLWSRLIDPANRPFLLWAKVYWAMSNPFARALSTPPESPLPIVIAFSHDSLERGSENLNAQYFIEAASSGAGEIVTRLLREEENLTFPILSDALIAAVRTMDENMALEIAGAMLLRFKQHEDTPFWPESMVWAATWLDMDQLLDTFLENGASTEPQATTQFPSPLYMASRLGHASTCRVLLAHKARTDVTKGSKSTAISEVAYHGHVNILQELVNARVPVSSMAKYSNEFLLSAAMSGSYGTIETLIKLPMNPDGGTETRFTSGWRPLTRACALGYPKTVKILLEHGADPNILGPYGYDTPLWFAVMRGPNLECVRHLLNHGADPNHRHLQPPLLLELATSFSGDFDAIVNTCHILAAGNQPILVDARDSDNGTALMRASQNQRLPLMRWLLENGADVNAKDDFGRSALYFAAATENVSIVEEILKHQPELAILSTRSGNTLLQVALPDLAVIKLLLDAGVSPEHADSSGDTIINSAIITPNPDLVSLLVEKKANIHHPDSSGHTPIWAAASRARDASLVRLLADSGANLSETDAEGRGLLHVALDGPPEIVKILLEFGRDIDVNHRDGKMRTALMAATGAANIGCIKLLLKAGCDINAQDSKGATALYYAIWNKNVELVSLLLCEPKVDANHMSLHYGTPLHQACKAVNVQVVRALLDWGADVNAVTPNYTYSTPLIAALLREKHFGFGDAGGKVDEVVRTLVRRGADVKFTLPGGIFHSPIIAACFAVEVNTINLLLDEGASAQLTDQITGRAPLHFAAANGIQNFQAVMLAYRGDMMLTDNEGKSCLHWAAQFGSAKTIDFILSKLSDQPMKMARYLEQADNDGWTPLCWAVRPSGKLITSPLRSEKEDDASSVRILLHHGAKREIKCRYGQDVNHEMTPLLLAQRYDVDDEIIDMLKYGLERKEGKHVLGVQEELLKNDNFPIRRYNKWTTVCDICQDQIFGLVYTCNSCPNYDVCTKCSTTTMVIFHNAKTKNDGKPHIMEIRKDREEYMDLPQTIESKDNAGEVVNEGEDKGDESNVMGHYEEMEVDPEDDDIL
ncbi:ankyrin repeat-containing domain protein [Trichoderma ceciliae]